jgi:NAD(P)-dependent dehydrogenase (short-subunit alcohol dehydrogenase family)
MGRSIALTLAREGARVVVNYRASRLAAREIVRLLHERGCEAVATQADIRVLADCRRLVLETATAYGGVDILIIGPGAGWHPAPPGELAPEDAIEDVLCEVQPIHNLLPLVLPGMYRQRWGRVIGIALHPTIPSPSYSYNAAKGARVQALLLAAQPAWDHGVTVNVLAPGPVGPVDSLEEASSQCDHGPAWYTRNAVSPQDVAEGVAFLCSEAGRYVSGCVLPYLFEG